MAAGEWGAGTHPAQGEQSLRGQRKHPKPPPLPLLPASLSTDRGGLGGYQQPRAHSGASDWWHQGHCGTGEPTATPGPGRGAGERVGGQGRKNGRGPGPPQVQLQLVLGSMAAEQWLSGKSSR